MTNGGAFCWSGERRRLPLSRNPSGLFSVFNDLANIPASGKFFGRTPVKNVIEPMTTAACSHVLRSRLRIKNNNK